MRALHIQRFVGRNGDNGREYQRKIGSSTRGRDPGTADARLFPVDRALRASEPCSFAPTGRPRDLGTLILEGRRRPRRGEGFPNAVVDVDHARSAAVPEVRATVTDRVDIPKPDSTTIPVAAMEKPVD